MWTIAKVRDGFSDLPYEKFHTFAVKRNGQIIGQLKWTNRAKNAGGAAWQGKVFKSPRHYGMDVSFFHSRKDEVLKWFKELGEDHFVVDTSPKDAIMCE